MEALGGIFWSIVICFAVGSFLALPYIWYHTGQASKKLSDLIHLQRETNVRLTKILDSKYSPP